MQSVVIEEFVAVERNTLRGFARVRMPSGMILNDVSIHRKGEQCWASPASKPMISRDGTVLKDAADKVKYMPIVEFVSRDVRDRFSNAVIEALRATHPEVLR